MWPHERLREDSFRPLPSRVGGRQVIGVPPGSTRIVRFRGSLQLFLALVPGDQDLRERVGEDGEWSGAHDRPEQRRFSDGGEVSPVREELYPVSPEVLIPMPPGRRRRPVMGLAE